MKRSSAALLSAALILTASSVFGEIDARPTSRATPTYREGEVIVKYRSGATVVKKEVSRGKHRSRTRIRKEFSGFNMDQLEILPGVSMEEVLRQYAADEEVEYAEPNYIVHTMVTPNDPQYFNLWGLAKVNASGAWATCTGSDSVVVAVIDSGVDYTHPDLAGNMFVNEAEQNGLPGVDDDGNGVVDDVHGFNAVRSSGDPMDDNGHGTHVAGTIGGIGDNGIGIAGLNWNVKVLACKFLDATGSGATSDAIECLQYVRALKDRGVNVVATNNSWGGGAASKALADAIQAQGDILFVAAAGNDTIDHAATPQYPADYDLPNVIAVAASDSADALASFSDYGRRTVHVAAPGDRILSTVPSGSYGYKSGTSMASPHVAGLAALLQTSNPDLDWRAIKNRILAGADPVAGATGKTVTGARINAEGSLACADRTVFSALKAPAQLQAGVPATVAALSINCGSPVGPVTASISTGETVILTDDGQGGDHAPGDGIFTARFTPSQNSELVQLSSPAGSERIR
jgi:thermitase